MSNAIFLSLSKQKHHERILLMRILFYLLRNVLLENQSKKTFSHEKVYCSFGLILKVFYQFFKKLSVAKNSITISGYSNDKYIYIYKYKSRFELIKQNRFAKIAGVVWKKAWRRWMIFLHLQIILWKICGVLIKFCKLIWLSFAN